MRFVVLTCLVIFLNSCSSIENQAQRRNFSLVEAMKIVPEKSDQNSIQSMLGPADLVMQIPDSDDIAWIFKDTKTGHQKLSLVFNNQKRLQSVLWLVSEDEPEIRLEISKKRFPDAKFVAKAAPWENPHAAPNEEFYVDDERGISITFRKTRQEVESISWYNPNLKPSADRKPAVKYEL
jgi:hypothetical protein